MAKDLSQVAVLFMGPCEFPGGVQDTLERTVTILSPEDAEKRTQDIRGIVIWPGSDTITEQLLTKFPSVSVVSSHSVGLNHIDIEACSKRKVRVGYTPGVVSPATAEIAWSLILSTARKIVHGHNKAHSADYMDAPRLLGKDVSGSTLGIVGMGRIGIEIARRAMGFSMKVFYHNRSRRSEEEEKSVCAEYLSDLGELLDRCDFVVCVLPASTETYRIFGREQFSHMRKDAIFVNVGRGSTVDHDALAEAVSSGHLFGAGLDVTDPEPLPRDHPLLTMENVVITPHLGTATVGTRVRMAELVVRNLVAGLKGEPLEECANPV